MKLKSPCENHYVIIHYIPLEIDTLTMKMWMVSHPWNVVDR